MKKLSLLSAFLLSCIISFAKHVPEETAQTVALHFLQQKGDNTITSANELRLAYTDNGTTPTFYIFSTGHSFALVSADDVAEPVLGYSVTNAFKATGIPKHITSFLSGYTEQITEMQVANVAARPEVADKWDALIANRQITFAAKTTAVTPLLSTTWNQSPYYNADCPYDYYGGGRSVTGCVATATAQVMKFWNWPTTGVGMHSYSSSCCGSLYANFGSTTYNWSAMPNNVTSSNAAVATLMYHVGVSVNMNYSASSSAAYVVSSASPITNCAEYALRTYFNYKSTLSGKKRSSYTESAWINLLKTELDAGRPIIMAGSGSGGGHCFVNDGYDASNYFHMNWGWAGSSDGYFNINALNPGSLGTGGGSGGFNSNQQAIIGVEPNTTPSGPALSLNAYVSPSPSTIFYGGAFSVTTNIANPGTTSFTGNFCAAAFNSTGTFVAYIDSIAGYTLPAGYMTSTISFSTTGLLSLLPGDYSIGIFARTTSGGWVAVANAGSYTNFVPFHVVNNNPLEVASVMTLSPTTFVQGAAASVTLNLQNDGSSFSGSYDMSLYSLDGTFVATIQTMSGMSLPSGYTYSAPYLTFSTSSLTAPPGTYLLAIQYNPGSAWYLCGADYYPNPILVTVAAPPPSPDIYEVNNTVATAYNLPLTFSSDVAAKSTPGSNIHVPTDNDYYKIVLPAGYNYQVTARVNDILSSDDAATYTEDVVWSYSTDGGSSWSAVYTDVMTGTIDIGGLTGGTVIFRVSPAFAGNLGTYLLKLSNITRSTSSIGVKEVNLQQVSIYPNPANTAVTVGLTGTGINARMVSLMDLQGRTLYIADVHGKDEVTIPLTTIASGNYVIHVATDAGLITRKITVEK